MSELRSLIRNEEILNFLRSEKKEKKIGVLYELFFKNSIYAFSYKTWQRHIKQLAERELITVKKCNGGALGNTTLIQAK